VERFHKALNDGNCEQIYSDADEVFQKSGSKEELTKINQDIRGRAS